MNRKIVAAGYILPVEELW